MKFLLRFLPNSLVGRVFSLYLASLLIFVCTGLGLFYQYQFSQYIEEELLSAEMMMNVAAQSIADSAVIGDYDTITKTLDRVIAQSHFAQAQFIDAKGAVVKAVNTYKVRLWTPQWLSNLVQAQLYDVNHNIEVGGKDYGVLRLTFAPNEVASELWRLALLALALSVGALVSGVVLIRIPLQRWLGNFDRVRAHEQDILSGAIEVNALLDGDAPIEIRHTFDILSRVASRLSAQREEAAVTLNAITDGVLTTDAHHGVIYCNPAAEQMLGMSRASLIGKNVRSLFPAAFPGEGATVDGMARRIEIIGRGGKMAIVDTTLSAIRSSTQEVVGYVLAFRDVTQQHVLDQQLRNELQTRERALESLRRVLNELQLPAQVGASSLPADDMDALTGRVVALVNERELGRRALDNQKFALDQHAIVSITDLNGAITYANDRFCEISGYSQAELLGANHRILKSTQHSTAFYDQLWASISQGQVWHGEICNLNKHGDVYWVDATIVPLMGHEGLPEQYIAIRTDITSRKNFEVQLEDQLRFVEVLLEATPTAIYLKDEAGRYLRLNKAFEALFGIERSQWIGKTVFDLMPAAGAAGIHAKDQELMQNGVAQTYEEEFFNRATEVMREGLFSKAPLTNSKGEITALVGTIQDITERNRIEHALREAKRNADAANKAKSDFLANMSHEIRTPMNGVLGMTDLTLETALNSTQREYLNIVKSSAQSLLVILNDILDFSKIEAGKLQIESVEFSLSNTITETLKTISARAEKKGLDVNCQLDPGLPERVRGDPGRIRQVLTNLCDNAVKFTSRGSVAVNAVCTSLAGGDVEIHLSVRDTGIGIPLDKQKGVFEAFNQADTSTTRQFGGTGLGLTICTRLVELMGGRLWLESEAGQGSTFHFTARVHRVAQPELPSQEPSIPSSTSTRLGRLNVLLVEDNPINQLLATTLLKKWGYTVVLAKNGQEAVDLFPSQAWDIVLMDMQMPVMGGLDATRLIRANEPKEQRVPIVAMTANAMASDRQACMDAGMDDHLAKPFNAATLQLVIEAFCTDKAGSSEKV